MIAKINWTSGGRLGVSEAGWIITATADLDVPDYHVWDVDDNYVGRFNDREAAVRAVKA